MSDDFLVIRDAVAKAAEFFAKKGITTGRLDAELLIGEAVKMDRLGLYMNMDRPLDAGERDKARQLIRRRAAREPVAYILGRREFRSMEFEVNPAVLVPRPETELLVDHTEDLLSAKFSEVGGLYRILELGTGSGAISVSLAVDLPEAQIIATEISQTAMDVARRNAERHGVAGRIEFRVQPDFAGIEGPFHAIVSNPPYIKICERESLTPDVRKYEPEVALFGGQDGTDLIRFLLREAPRLLAPNGFLIMEIGWGTKDRVCEIGEEFGMHLEKVFNDYAGIERMVLLVRKP